MPSSPSRELARAAEASVRWLDGVAAAAQSSAERSQRAIAHHAARLAGNANAPSVRRALRWLPTAMGEGEDVSSQPRNDVADAAQAGTAAGTAAGAEAVAAAPGDAASAAFDAVAVSAAAFDAAAADGEREEAPCRYTCRLQSPYIQPTSLVSCRLTSRSAWQLGTPTRRCLPRDQRRVPGGRDAPPKEEQACRRLPRCRDGPSI